MNYAITMIDGSTAIMQTADSTIDVYECIQKWSPAQSAQVVDVREISPEEAKHIRASRPVPPPQLTLQQRVAALEAKLK